MYSLSLLLLVLFGGCEGRATLEDNGYNDVVIAISPQIEEDQSLVENIKQLFTEASEELYKATRHRTYFKRVKILLPKTWSTVPASPSTDETFDTAEIVVDQPNPAYGDNPYTVQVGDCGEPGDRTHFTPWFINNHNDGAAHIFGKTEKVVVHEWARLRYGVYEEYGYPGDEKFPMFYYKTTWTINGQENVLAPNLCTDTDLNGISVDVTTGGACKESQDTGLPDNNCYYQPFLNNSVSSSYMSIPYLDSVVTFCDDTEDYIHNSELPTKHNLYCEGKSVWSVIMENPDFQNDANQPTDGLDTLPEFVVVQPQSSKYVLVMDVSASMISANIPRDKNMLDAAKRWIKYEVANGTEVGFVVFSDETSSHPIMGRMITVNSDHDRNALIDVLDSEVKFGGQTCIGCGLNIAQTWPMTLNNSNGGVIILITDGQQRCRTPSSPNCLEISDVIDNLIEHKVRVVTIALGLDADPALEDVAMRTGGKSYYIDDSSGPGNINDAFTGSLTYQPGDVLANTDTEVYQKDWTDVSKKVVGTFDIDASIGRSTSFQVEVRTKDNDNNCKEDLDITLVDPSEDHHRTDLKFKCDASNFGVFKHAMPDLTIVGKWTYMIKPKENFTSISVKVESKSRSASTEPVMTKCWIGTGSQEVDTNINVKLAVVAQVTQGSKPVLGAKVEAQVERPAGADGSPWPSMKLELLDNGSGADKIKNDGMYARYFAKYTGKGRYSVKCQVTGNEDTNINGGFTAGNHNRGSRVYPPFHDPNNPLCCGSNALVPGANLTKTGNFTRQAPGGSFQVTNDVDENADNIPPGRVDDLVVLGYSNLTVTLQFTSPGDDLDSNDQPAKYTVKFSTTSGNLTGDNFMNTEFNTEIEEEDLVDSSLSPQNGSTIIQLNLKIGLFEKSIKYYFAMIAVDEAGNTSPVSNTAQFYINAQHHLETTPAPPVTTSTASPKPCPDKWMDASDVNMGCLLFDSPNITWIEASRHCMAENGSLVEILNTKQQEFVAVIATAIEMGSGQVVNWWIGATDINHEGSWYWSHSESPVTATFWARGEPNGGTLQNFAMLKGEDSYAWDDVEEERLCHPICQSNAN